MINPPGDGLKMKYYGVRFV